MAVYILIEVLTCCAELDFVGLLVYRVRCVGRFGRVESVPFKIQTSHYLVKQPLDYLRCCVCWCGIFWEATSEHEIAASFRKNLAHFSLDQDTIISCILFLRVMCKFRNIVSKIVLGYFSQALLMPTRNVLQPSGIESKSFSLFLRVSLFLSLSALRRFVFDFSKVFHSWETFHHIIFLIGFASWAKWFFYIEFAQCEALCNHFLMRKTPVDADVRHAVLLPSNLLCEFCRSSLSNFFQFLVQ